MVLEECNLDPREIKQILQKTHKDYKRMIADPSNIGGDKEKDKRDLIREINRWRFKHREKLLILAKYPINVIALAGRFSQPFAENLLKGNCTLPIKWLNRTLHYLDEANSILKKCNNDFELAKKTLKNSNKIKIQ